MLIRCRYCEHDNPADSTFCSACGGALALPPHLASCPRCGTVNPVKVTLCCWCGGPLSARRPLPHRRSRVIVGAAALAVVAALGYYTYRQSSYADAHQAPAASREPAGRPAPAAALLDEKNAADAPKPAGAEGAAAPAVPAAPPSANPPAAPVRAAAPAVPATPPSANPPAAPVRAAPNQPRTARQPVKSQEAKAGESALRPQACTQAAAALGLCATKSIQKKEPETAAVEAAIKRPTTTGGVDPGVQEPPRPPACTEALAALGLCAPKPTQRRE